MTSPEKMTRENLDSSKRNSGAQGSKIYCCYEETTNIHKFSSEGLNKRVLELSGDGPLENYRLVLDEKVNFTLTNRGFRTNNHAVATYEQVEKRFFSP